MEDNEHKLFREFIGLEVYANLDQDVIVTTEDKLKLTLTAYYSKVGRQKDWLAPFGISLTILTIFLTTSFKDFLFSSSTWQAIFIILFAANIIWLLFSLRSAFKRTSIDDIIIELKKNKKTQ